MRIIIAFLCVYFFNCAISFAHGDLDERIAEVSSEIEQSPDSSFLYFKRAKLYYEHEDFSLAIDDLDAAAKLGHEGLVSNLYYAKAYKGLLKYKQSIKYLDRILAEEPEYVRALRIKSDIYLIQKKYAASAALSQKVINYSIKTLPENYIQTSDAWLKANTAEGFQNAIQVLQQGLSDLGNIYTLQYELKAAYLSKKQYKNALGIQKTIIEQSARKERPYFDAGNICLEMEDPTQAKAYFIQALEAIKALHPKHKRLRVTKQLRKDIEVQIQNANSSSQ